MRCLPIPTTSIGIYGGREHQVQVQVQFEPAALAQRGISVTQLRTALQSDNVNESAGDLANGRQEVRFRVIGQFDSLDPLRRTSMTIFIKRETGTNVLETMKGVRKQIDEFNAPGGLLKSYKNDRYGIRLRLVVDDTYYIQRAIGLVRENLLLGGSLAVLLESFLYPFVIMFSVPLATVGGFAGLRLVRILEPTQQRDTLTMLGFVILIGVVVNNAILIVHQALNFIRGIGEGEHDFCEKLPPREAVRQSVKTRTRPILMTTATSVFGMAPLVLAPGAGSELYRGLGAVVVGGLICSTIFTLVVVPLLFSLVLDCQAALGRVLSRRVEVADSSPATPGS